MPFNAIPDKIISRLITSKSRGGVDVKTPSCFLVLLALSVLAGCSGSGDTVSGEKEGPAVNEKSATESAKDYLMDPVRQKKKGVKELDEALAKRDSDISKQLDEVKGR